MDPRPRRRQRHRHVQRRVRADAHDVEPFPLEHLLIVAVATNDAMLVRPLLQRRRVDVAQRHQLHPIEMAIGRRMTATDPPAPHNPSPQRHRPRPTTPSLRRKPQSTAPPAVPLPFPAGKGPGVRSVPRPPRTAGGPQGGQGHPLLPLAEPERIETGIAQVELQPHRPLRPAVITAPVAPRHRVPQRITRQRRTIGRAKPR